VARNLGMGFCTFTSLTCDYAVIFAVPVLCAFALYRNLPSWGRLVYFGFGALPPLMAWGLSNYLAFGSPFALGQHNVADAYYFKLLNTGLAGGVGLPRLGDLGGVLFGRQRGILFLSPFLILAPVGWWRLWRENQRPEALTAAAATLGILLLVISLPYWHGGWAVGIRYFVSAVPFCLVGVAAAIKRGRDNALTLPLFQFLVLISIAHLGLSAATFPSFPSEFTDPVYQLAWPLFRDGALMPPSLFLGGMEKALWILIMVLVGAVVLLSQAWTRRDLVPGAVAAGLAAAALLVLASTSPPTTPGAERRLQQCARRIDHADTTIRSPQGPASAETRRLPGARDPGAK
jgi:hypothetical protein